MKRPRAIDANVIIRFFLNDHPTLSKKAQSIIADAQKGAYSLYVDEVVVAEVVWVLSSFYEINREGIASRMLTLLSEPWVVNPRKKIILTAFALYRTSSVDYIDAWLAAVSRKKRIPLETFDTGLRRLLIDKKKRFDLA